MYFVVKQKEYVAVNTTSISMSETWLDIAGDSPVPHVCIRCEQVGLMWSAVHLNDMRTVHGSYIKLHSKYMHDQ